MDNPHIVLVADGRSPITRNWIKMLRSGGYAISLVSTYPYQPISGLEKQKTIPVGFSSLAGGQVNTKHHQERPGVRKQVMGSLRPFLMRVRAELTPRLMGASKEKLHEFVRSCQPDIVHALRIPFEGLLCEGLPEEFPLVVSVWGNDLTLHAKSSHYLGRMTRRAVTRADALLADAARDIALANDWGLRDHTPTAVVPGSGGLDISAIDACRPKADEVMKTYGIPYDRPLIINPRGFRPGSVHQDVFFNSIPLVLDSMPNVYFLCPGMQGQPAAQKWVQRLDISHAVQLLPFLRQSDLWALYTNASIYISLSSHDGTPNSFLESITCGIYPIVGDIASLREWVIPGKNGSLVDPRDPVGAAREICGVLGNENLRTYAAKKNRLLIEQRAQRELVLQKVDALYKSLC